MIPFEEMDDVGCTHHFDGITESILDDMGEQVDFAVLLAMMFFARSHDPESVITLEERVP